MIPFFVHIWYSTEIETIHFIILWAFFHSLYFFRNSVAILYGIWYHFCPFDELNYEKVILKLRSSTLEFGHNHHSQQCVCFWPGWQQSHNCVYLLCRSYTQITNSSPAALLFRVYYTNKCKEVFFVFSYFHCISPHFTATTHWMKATLLSNGL